MADLMKPALAAAVSLLGLSLGVTDASAQKQPGAPTGDTQGILIGLNKPGSTQIKGEDPASTQIKGENPTSMQWKSPTSGQIKGEGPISNQYKSDQIKSTQLKSTQLKDQGPASNQIKW
jgi:hypothetical protein